MKTLKLITTAGSIACIAFALNAAAQTNNTVPSSRSETIEQHLDDGTITTKVKANLLAAKNLQSTHISVHTRQGIVWLSGTVPTANDKAAAEDVAQHVTGVAGVKNQLKVAAQ